MCGSVLVWALSEADSKRSRWTKFKSKSFIWEAILGSIARESGREAGKGREPISGVSVSSAS